MSRLAAVGLWLLLLAPGTAHAVELDRGDLRLELRGSLRNLFTLTRDVRRDDLRRQLEQNGALFSPTPPCPLPITPCLDLGALLSTTRSDTGRMLWRARIDGQAVWRDQLYAQVVYDSEARFGSALDTLGFAIGDTVGNRTWWDLDRTISSNGDGDWRHSIYRAWMRWEEERVELTLGRQRIPLGRGRLWNPIDLFNPIPPLAVEAQQRIGQDAARLRFRLRDGVWTEAIWSPQDNTDDRRGALRLELSRTELDAALMVGSFRRNWVFGADGAGNLGGAAYRFEATYTHERAGGRTWQVVGSLDYTFPVGSGLYGLVEHFYNENLIDPGASATVPAPPSCDPTPAATLDRASATQCLDEMIALLAAGQELFLDRLFSSVRNQTGVLLSYDLTSLLRGNLLAIYDWHGPSVAVFPVLGWSVRSDVDVSIGLQLFVGKDDGRSEYGDRATLVFAQVDLFF